MSTLAHLSQTVGKIFAEVGDTTGWMRSIDGGASFRLDDGDSEFDGEIEIQRRPPLKADGSNWDDDDDGARASLVVIAATDDSTDTATTTNRVWGVWDFRAICTAAPTDPAPGWLGVRCAIPGNMQTE